MPRISGEIVSIHIFCEEITPSWSLSSYEKSQVMRFMCICCTICSDYSFIVGFDWGGSSIIDYFGRRYR